MLLPPQLFLDYDELYLKVRFDDGDGKGLRHLAPDQRITATPRALVAEVAKIAKNADTAKVRTRQAGHKSRCSVRMSYPISTARSPRKCSNLFITTAQLNEQILKYLKPRLPWPHRLPVSFLTGRPSPYIPVRRASI